MSDPDIYTVGWICAVETELVAAASFLDEEHDDPESLPVNDNNSYVLGRIGKHNVVIAALPDGQYGLVTAATVARDMVRSFPNIRFGLMVGIGGGAPSANHDIRLGDIVVSSPGPGSGGVFQYDYGKTIQDSKFVVTSHLNQPPQFILAAVATLRAQYKRRGHNIEKDVAHVLQNNRRLQVEYRKPESGTDRLYTADYKHAGTKAEECTLSCNASYLTNRPDRSDEQECPTIHYGTIASANQLIKDASIRNKLSAEKDVLCFEMEAAGLMNHFPCLVVRGICDYSDTHKNKIWQGYASMVAAAYAKDLLRKVAPNKVQAEKKVIDVLSDVTSSLASLSVTISDTQNKVETLHTDMHYDHVIEWLVTVNPSTNFNQAITARNIGSCHWFIESKAYTRWKQEHNSSIWLYGAPGCGKTILATTIIEDLRNDPDCCSILYFYFDFTDVRKQSLDHAIRVLIGQIYHQKEGTRKQVQELFHTYKGRKEQPSTSSMQKIFLDLIQRSGEVWIVLDALDECASRSEVLRWLHDLHESSSSIHLLLTSRPEYDIKVSVEDFVSDGNRMPIQGDQVDGDISDYVRTRVRENYGLSRWKHRPHIQTEIESALIGRANGMFRWVACQIDALEKCYDLKTLRRVLASLPRTLDDTYTRILNSIPPEHAHHTKRILQFLTYSERPLRLEEAVDAIAVDLETGGAENTQFDPTHRMPQPGEILKYCSSLAVLVSRVGEENEIIQEIQLAHFSVKDYLTTAGKNPAWFLEEGAARSCIAQVCLTYLLQVAPKHDVSIGLSRQLYPFSQYSARYWSHHAALVERKYPAVFRLAMIFFSKTDILHECVRLYNPDYPWIETPKEGKEDKSITPLYYAALEGLSACVEALLDKGAKVNRQGGFYGNPLQAASDGGHESIVRMLLEKGAKINRVGGCHHGALQAALDSRHFEIAELLIHKGGQLNGPIDDFAWQLYSASGDGYIEVVRFLLKMGANPNAAGNDGWTPLLTAFSSGQIEVARLLLEKGAAPNIASNNGWTPLSSALGNGNIEMAKEMVKLLHEKGADLNIADDDGITPLLSASRSGNIEIARLLSEEGADLNAKDNDGCTPLFFASGGDHIDIVEFLLERDADPNITDNDGRTPLYSATVSGHSEIIRLLLEKGADPNIATRSGRTPVSYAADYCHIEVVGLLLEKGADPNIVGNDGYTPLISVAFSGGIEMIRLLLEKGADPNIAKNDGGTALHLASNSARVEVVRLLLEKGANPNVANNNGRTALFYASDRDGRNYHEIRRLLLEKGAA